MSFLDRFAKKAEKQETIPEVSEEIEKIYPRERSLEWFLSEDGIESFKKHFTIDNFFKEDEEIKELKEGLELINKGTELDAHKALVGRYDMPKWKANYTPMPWYFLFYFGQAMTPYRSVSLAVSITTLGVTRLYEKDKYGNRTKVDYPATAEEILSFEENPLLGYVTKLDEIANINWDDVPRIVLAICSYLQEERYGRRNKNALAENEWIFDKSIYVDDFGQIRPFESSLNYCLEMAPKPEHFEQFK